MAKNYEAVHYIREKLTGFDPVFVNAVLKCVDMIDRHKEGDGCMSNTSALFLIARKCGYDPEFCYGLCNLDDKEFYHAWLEINGMIIDPSIYGSIRYGSGFENYDTDIPVIEKTDADLLITYRKYEFDDDWKELEKLGICTLCGFIDGKTLEEYMDGLPLNGMWKLTCIYLDAVPTKAVVEDLRKYCKGVVFDKYKG